MQCGHTGQRDGSVLVLDVTEQGGLRFHHPTQNGVRFKTYELFSFWNFPFNLSWSRLTVIIETAEAKL